MNSRARTNRYAIIGAITTDIVLAIPVVIILSKVGILPGLVVALVVATGTLAVAAVWMIRGRRPSSPVEDEPKDVKEVRTAWRFLAVLGAILIGFGETFLSGILFVFIWFYCARNNYCPTVISYIDNYNAFFLPLFVCFFPLLHTVQRQWFLVVGNAMGPLFVFFLLGLWASGIP